MVIMELAENHVAELASYNPALINYTQVENCYEPMLVVSEVVAGSYLDHNATIIPGDLISTVNDQQVRTLAEFRAALSKSKQDLVAITTVRGVLVVLDVKKVAEADKKLSTDVGYPKAKPNRDTQGSYKK